MNAVGSGAGGRGLGRLQKICYLVNVLKWEGLSLSKDQSRGVQGRSGVLGLLTVYPREWEESGHVAGPE